MEGLTAEEAAVYDRQLRVWGVEAQQLYETVVNCFPISCNMMIHGQSFASDVQPEEIQSSCSWL